MCVWFCGSKYWFERIDLVNSELKVKLFIYVWKHSPKSKLKKNLSLKTNSGKSSKSYRQNRINLQEKAILLQSTQTYCSALGQSSSELNLHVESLVHFREIHQLFTPPHDQSNDGPPREVHSLHSITSANEHYH